MFDVIVIGGAPAGENVAARAVRNRVEPFAGEQVATAFGEGGIDVRFSTSVQSVARPEPGGPVTVRLAGGEAVDADELLVATGRKPATDHVGLPTVGLRARAVRRCRRQHAGVRRGRWLALRSRRRDRGAGEGRAGGRVRRPGAIQSSGPADPPWLG